MEHVTPMFLLQRATSLNALLVFLFRKFKFPGCLLQKSALNSFIFTRPNISESQGKAFILNLTLIILALMQIF